MTHQPRTDSQSRRARIFYVGAFSVSLAGFAAFMYWGHALILPIIFGAFFAYIFRPLFRKNFFPFLPKWVGTTFLVLAILGGMALIVKKAMASRPNDREKLELQVRVKYKLNKKYQDFFEIDYAKKTGNFMYNAAKKDLDPFMVEVNKTLDLTAEQVQQIEKYRKGGFGPDQIFSDKYYQYFQENQKHPAFGAKVVAAAAVEAAERGIASETAASSTSLHEILHLFSTWILCPLVFMFLLADKGEILRFFVNLIPNKYFEMTLTIIDEVDVAIGNYLRGTALECALVGASFSLGLLIIGIEFKAALVIGFIAGLTNVIPFLGTMIGLVVGVGYALIAEDIQPWFSFIHQDNLPVLVIAIVTIVHLLDNIVFQPVVIGGAVSLHPLVVIVGVLAGSVIFGFAGMLFAIPAIVIVKTVGETLTRELKAYKII